MARKNKGLFRDSAVAESGDLINGTPYVEVAKAYYESRMYENDVAAIEDMVDGVLPVFNAVPKVVNISSSFAVSGDIEAVAQDREWIDGFVDVIGLEQEKGNIATELILGKSVLMEIQSGNFSTDTDLQIAYGTEEFPYGIAFYAADEYDLITAGGNIYQCEINGKKLEFDGEKYTVKDSKKTYVRQEDGTVIMKIEVDGDVIDEFTFTDGVMPIAEVSTSYDMRQLFYSIDRYNEFDVFIRSIFYLSGEPILVGTGLKKLSDETANAYADDRYSKMKTMFTNNENAMIKLLELNGTSTSMMMQKQRELKENITKDFPEFAISEVLSGGNVSEETTRMRLTEVLARINELRENLAMGINSLINSVYIIEKKTPEVLYIRFGEMMDTKLISKATVVFEALEKGLISRKSAMNSIKSLYIGEDVDKELARIDEDATSTSMVPTVPNNTRYQFVAGTGTTTTTQETTTTENNTQI